MTEGGSFCRYKRAHTARFIFTFAYVVATTESGRGDNIASKFLHTHPPGGRGCRVGARFDNDCIGVGEVAKLASVNVQLTNTFSSIIPQLPRDGQSRCSFLFSRYREVPSLPPLPLIASQLARISTCTYIGCACNLRHASTRCHGGNDCGERENRDGRREKGRMRENEGRQKEREKRKEESSGREGIQRTKCRGNGYRWMVERR